MHKLNAKGFAHQVLIMALVVVAVIGGIGSYIYLYRSHANTLDPGNGAYWHTLKSVSGTWTITGANGSTYTALPVSQWVGSGKTYRYCVNVHQKYLGTGTPVNGYRSIYLSDNKAALSIGKEVTFYSKFTNKVSATKTVCSNSSKATAGATVTPLVSDLGKDNAYPTIVTLVTWQRYY